MLVGNAKSEMLSERLCALMLKIVDFEGLADIFFSFAKEKIQKRLSKYLRHFELFKSNSNREQDKNSFLCVQPHRVIFLMKMERL